MALHRNIPDTKIPESLRQPLIFGDRKQIEALYALEADINLMTTEKAMIADGELKYFEVTIEYGGTQEIKVLATDEDDAKEKAEEEADYDRADIEVDFISAREVKK